MKKKPFTLFLFSVSLLLILILPFFYHAITTVSPDEIPYKGIINLWNITDWRTGGSSCSSFLKKRAQEFESYNGYSFIEITDMTVFEAEEALKSGLAPDMISYPSGFESGLKFSSLPSVNTIFPGTYDKGYPYMCGAYCILINTDMLDREGILIPEGWGVTPKELLEKARLGISFDSEKGYSSFPSASLYKYPKAEGPSLTSEKESEQPEAVLSLNASQYSGGLNSFCNGKSCVLIASHRQLYEAKLLYEDNKAPTFTNYALSGYTDMVQIIGAVSCEDTKKLKVCTDFAQYLLSESVQQKLEALGVFPVIKELDIYQSDEAMNSIYKLLCTDGYYAQAKDRPGIYELAEQSLHGDSDALSKLRSMAGYKK